MLFKNEERYKLTDKEIEAVKSSFSRFPVSLIFCPEVYRKRIGSTKPTGPESVQIPCVESVATSKGTDMWRYAENTVNNNGKISYLPRTIHFTGSLKLNENDIELAWFILNCSSICKNSKNPSKRGRFYIEFYDPQKDAKVDVSVEKQVNQIRNLIYNDVAEGGLGDDQIRQLCRSYFIAGSDMKSPEELRGQLFKRLGKEKDGFTEFLENTKLDEKVSLKARIQVAIDNGIIKFVYKGRGWWYFDENGNKQGSASIINISPTVKPEEGLFKHLLDNPISLEQFNLAVGYNKVETATEAT